MPDVDVADAEGERREAADHVRPVAEAAAAVAGARLLVITAVSLLTAPAPPCTISLMVTRSRRSRPSTSRAVCTGSRDMGGKNRCCAVRSTTAASCAANSPPLRTAVGDPSASSAATASGPADAAVQRGSDPGATPPSPRMRGP